MIEEMTTYRLRCDDGYCGAEVVVHATNTTDALEDAGWVNQQGQDLCPKHRRY